jgi:hypothetical protein
VIVAGKPGRKVGIAAKRNTRSTGQRRRHTSQNEKTQQPRERQ